MVTLKIKNLDAFKRNVERFVSALNENVNRALAAGASSISDAARERVPEKDRILRESIAVVEGEDNLTYTVEAVAPHAKYVEFGTRHSPAKPFMTPAAEGNAEGVRDLVIGAINETIGSIK